MIGAVAEKGAIDGVQGPARHDLPGCRLRAEREARGLTVADIAQSIKFSPRQIEALENDDFTSLPGTTFVRGFVRGYAKLLKLDPAPLLAMLSQEAQVPVVRPPESIGATMPVPGGRRFSWLLLATAVLLAVAASLAGWHFLGLPESQLSVPRPAESSSEAVSVRPPNLRVEVVAPTQEAVAAPDAVAAGGRQLVFTFHGKSWVEVRDASRRVLLTGENPPDSRQVVVGRPPFQLLIGNAAEVELQFDGEPIDLRPHTRAEVARFTLD